MRAPLVRNHHHSLRRGQACNAPGAKSARQIEAGARDAGDADAKSFTHRRAAGAPYDENWQLEC
eukprot:254193-Lingulodinium_polyedra.AAC.1